MTWPIAVVRVATSAAIVAVVFKMVDAIVELDAAK